jgi:hypothetical protein
LSIAPSDLPAFVSGPFVAQQEYLMLVKDFQAKIASLPDDPIEYQLYLAEPDTIDGPDVDVELIPVVRVEWDAQQKALRLFPEEEDSDGDSLTTAADVIAEIPEEVDSTPDATLQVEVPIVRPQTNNNRVSFGEVHDIVVGQKSFEVWLLVRPRNEYRDDDLPD